MSTEDLHEIFDRKGSGPLSGIVVADFSRVLAGPYATMMLADLGATVIKVEGPGGDDTRMWRPPVRDEDATYYLSINRNKYDVVLDFKDSGDLELARELARRADVVVENFKPGGLVKFGLDYDAVAKDNPNVVYSSVTGFGPSNPQPGYDLLVQGLSGFMSLTGDADGPPFRAGVAIFDVITGLHTTIGILASLQHRLTTGEGQKVDTNLLSSALSGLVNQTSGYVAAGSVPHRMGNEHPSLYPYQPMPTKDGDLIIACGNDRQFGMLSNGVGRPEWLEDDRFATAFPRNRHRKDLEPLLTEALSHRTAQEWYEILSAAGLPCAPINTIEQGVQLAESMGLDPVAEAGSGDRVIPTVRNPITMSKTQVSYDLAPPTLGQDSERVRAWLSTPAGERDASAAAGDSAGDAATDSAQGA
ncbi:CaiB/BaiF CoA transferase family protein [Brevibacterium jeotgali]|uniref:Crotonobetainyl-CoA:carnitine CoA-transferase CaiB n=1 Tax=Brevibacterium jeotgali TaxID=1262550 RepID=A0A2H1L541_9MICO|nr:CoA transferase [Brevibacterium jeotgali]TWB98530.1 crotonobetainyl-CoA:carnitine CoA-transferase CaiB-like acyl-CoA transferase [Brevibacterium jeotgali]SMY12017.1 Crotonobetainyl-CoA:carnitine CoA-transferase CaiB [Brevibacterium jeotgali]